MSMVEQNARVVRAGADGVWVEPVETAGGCGSCGGKGCGARRLAELFSDKPRNFLVDTQLSLQPGDQVVVGVPEGAVLAAAGRLYGLPLAAMLIGAWAGQSVWGGDVGAVVGLVAGGLAGVLLGRGRSAARPVVIRQERQMKIEKGLCR